MAGGGATVPQKGGKKGVDFAVNLIPSVDLFSVLIAFLLITAVWTQISRIDTDQALSKTPSASPPAAPDRSVDILMTSDEVVVKLAGDAAPARRFARSPEATLLRDVRAALRGARERSAEPPKVTLAAEDGVVFGQMIRMMDLCLDVGLSRITIANPTALRSGIL